MNDKSLRVQVNSLFWISLLLIWSGLAGIIFAGGASAFGLPLSIVGILGLLIVQILTKLTNEVERLGSRRATEPGLPDIAGEGREGDDNR